MWTRPDFQTAPPLSCSLTAGRRSANRSRELSRTLIALAICLVAGWSIAFAQTPSPSTTPPSTIPNASLSGVVTDPSGALVPEAGLTLQAPHRSALKTVSDSQGAFRFAAVPAGTYQLTVAAHGFRNASRDHLRIEAGQSRRIDIGLHIEIQHEQIDVLGTQLDASPDHGLGAIVFSSSELDSLPTNPTDLQTQLQLLAGADPSTPPQIFVDGFTASRLPPKASIREIRINQNPYSAQYDLTGLGRIEVFTKPGTDQLHGSLLLIGDDSTLNSRNPYVYGQPPYSAFYSEGGVGGPVTKNSSWFLSGDRQDVGAQSFVYATIDSASPPYTATVDSPQTSTDLGPRFDIQLGRIHTLSFRYQFGHQIQDNVLQTQLALPTQALNIRHTDQTFQFSDTQAWTEHAVNETRFQFMRTNDSSVNVSAASDLQVQGAFDGGGNLINQLHDGQNEYELQDHYSLAHGGHLFRFGGRIRDYRDDNTSAAGYNGVYIFSSLGAYETTTQGLASGLTPAQIRAAGGGASLFTYALGNPHVEVNVADVAAYFEDEWRMTPNTTLDAGLRFESQSLIHDHADFAPRVGWSWAIGALSGTSHDRPAWAVLRAGFGIFYQRFTTEYISIAERENGVTQQQYVVNNPDFYPAVPAPNALGPDAVPTIYSISPQMHAPYVIQEGVSLDKDFFKKLSVSLDYSFYRGVHQFLVPNINAPLPGTYDPSDPASGVRPLGKLENNYQYQSEGISKRNRLFLNIHYRTRPLTVYGTYTFGYSNADTTGASYTPSNQYDYRADYGRAANDIRNRAYFGGLVNLPFNIQFDPVLVLQSSMPFNITTGTDLNGDTQFNDRPAFATDLTRPSVYRTKWGNFDADPLPGQKIIPINYADGPSLVLLQMLLAKGFSVGPRVADSAAAQSLTSGKAEVQRRYQLNLGVEAQNVLNIVNGGPPVGVLGSPLFGQSTSLSTSQFSNPQANRILYLRLNLAF